jgi:hypothetical protein
MSAPHLSGPGWAQGIIDQLNVVLADIWLKFAKKAHAHAIADVTGLQTALNNAGGGEGGPHTHAIADLDGLQTALDGKGTSNFSGSYSDLTNKPALFDGAYASLSGIPASFTPAAHNQAISTITGLQAALDGKSAIDHTHAGGGSDPWTIVALDADFTTSSATAVDVTGLSFAPAANGRYMFEAVIGIRTASAAVNPRIGFAWATGLTDGIAQIDESQTATARLMANGNIAAALLVAVGGLPNATQTWPVTIWGWVKAGATPSGSIRIQLATETAGTVVRVTAHSYLRYRSY